MFMRRSPIRSPGRLIERCDAVLRVPGASKGRRRGRATGERARAFRCSHPQMQFRSTLSCRLAGSSGLRHLRAPRHPSFAATQSPSLPSAAVLLLPEGRAGLEIVHQERRRLEGRVAGARTRQAPARSARPARCAVAVDDGQPEERPRSRRLAARCAESPPRPCRDSARAREPRASRLRRGNSR